MYPWNISEIQLYLRYHLFSVGSPINLKILSLKHLRLNIPPVFSMVFDPFSVLDTEIFDHSGAVAP